MTPRTENEKLAHLLAEPSIFTNRLDTTSGYKNAQGDWVGVDICIPLSQWPDGPNAAYSADNYDAATLSSLSEAVAHDYPIRVYKKAPLLDLVEAAHTLLVEAHKHWESPKGGTVEDVAEHLGEVFEEIWDERYPTYGEFCAPTLDFLDTVIEAEHRATAIGALDLVVQDLLPVLRGVTSADVQYFTETRLVLTRD